MIRALLVLVALLLPTLASAAVYITKPGVTCANDTRLTAPVKGIDYCYDSTADSGKGLLYHWTGSVWESMSSSGASGPANVIPRYTGVGGALTSSALADDGTNVTATRPITVAMDSSVIPPSFALHDTRASSGRTYVWTSTGGDLKLMNPLTGDVYLWANHGTVQPRVGLANADPNVGDNGGRSFAVLQNDGALTADLGVGDITRLISLDVDNKASIGPESDIEIGACPWLRNRTYPSGKQYCDAGAGGRGTTRIHSGRNYAGASGALQVITHVFGAGIGGEILLAPIYTTNIVHYPEGDVEEGLVGGGALLRGLKLNATPGDAAAYLPMLTSIANGNLVERARLSLGLMVGTTTDAGAGTVNALTGFFTNNVAGLTTTVDVLCDAADPTKKRTLTIAGGIVTLKGTCA